MTTEEPTRVGPAANSQAVEVRAAAGRSEGHVDALPMGMPMPEIRTPATDPTGLATVAAIRAMTAGPDIGGVAVSALERMAVPGSALAGLADESGLSRAVNAMTTDKVLGRCLASASMARFQPQLGPYFALSSGLLSSIGDSALRRASAATAWKDTSPMATLPDPPSRVDALAQSLRLDVTGQPGGLSGVQSMMRVRDWVGMVEGLGGSPSLATWGKTFGQLAEMTGVLSRAGTGVRGMERLGMFGATEAALKRRILDGLPRGLLAGHPVRATPPPLATAVAAQRTLSQALLAGGWAPGAPSEGPVRTAAWNAAGDDIFEDDWVLPGSLGTVEYPLLTAAGFRVASNRAWAASPFVIALATYGVLLEIAPEFVEWIMRQLDRHAALLWLLGIAQWTSNEITKRQSDD